MQPSFPSSTFPNHYTLATGLVPDHHGIIANVFYHKATNTTFALGKNQNDPAYWGGDPIWLTAKRQGKRVGVVYWPGSDVAIKGVYPDYWHSYAKKVPPPACASQDSPVRRRVRCGRARRSKP